MRVIDRLKAAYKAWNTGDWVNSDAPGNVSSTGVGRAYIIPGTNINWDALTGDLWTCPAAQACLNWIWRNFPQAPPIVQEMKGDDWQAVPAHALTNLLTRPNPVYDGSVLFQGLILSLMVNGNSYVIIERNGNGTPKELWWVPHQMISPYTRPGGDARFVDYYWYSPPGRAPMIVPVEDVCHVRWGADPHDPRLGLSPWASASRSGHSLQLAANYRPNILRNFGVIGKLISPPAELQTVTFDPAIIKRDIDSQSQGDRAGGTVVTDFPLNVQHPGVSPKDMDLQNMEDRPEADFHALAGIPAQVTGCHVGRLSKTFANYGEAREAAWEEGIMPLGSMFGCQLGYKLLPEMVPPAQRAAVLARYRLTFDYSNVRPLQPDLDKLHDRARKDWMANLITLAEWKQETGRVPEPGDELIRYRDLAMPGVDPNAEDEKTTSTRTDNEKTVRLRYAEGDWTETFAEKLGLPRWDERHQEELKAIRAEEALVSGNGRGH